LTAEGVLAMSSWHGSSGCCLGAASNGCTAGRLQLPGANQVINIYTNLLLHVFTTALLTTLCDMNS
jgi:hypothetical protein